MKINEIVDGTKKEDLTAEISEAGTTHEFTGKDGASKKFISFKVKDETGEINAVLFQEYLDENKDTKEEQFLQGKKVCFKNCWCAKYNSKIGEQLQIRTGKFGRVAILA